VKEEEMDDEEGFDEEGSDDEGDWKFALEGGKSAVGGGGGDGEE